MAIDTYLIMNARKTYNKLCDISQDEKNAENLKTFLEDNQVFFFNIIEKRKPNFSHKAQLQSGQIKIDNENFKINERFITNSSILSSVLNIDEILASSLLYQSIKNINNGNITIPYHENDKNKNNEKLIMLSAFHSYYTNRYYIILAWKFILSGLIDNKFGKTIHEIFSQFINEFINTTTSSIILSDTNNHEELPYENDERPIHLMIDYIKEISQFPEKLDLPITEEQESIYIHLLSKKENIINYEKKLMNIILIQLFNLHYTNCKDAMSVIQRIVIEGNSSILNNLLSMILEYLQLPVDNDINNSTVSMDNNLNGKEMNIEDELRNSKNNYLLNIEFVQSFNNVVLNKELWRQENLGVRAILLVQWTQQFQRYPYIAKKYGMTKEKLDILLNEAFKTNNFLKTLKNYMYLPKKFNSTKRSTSNVNFMELAVPNSPFTPGFIDDDEYITEDYTENNFNNNNNSNSSSSSSNYNSFVRELSSSSSLYLDAEKSTENFSSILVQQNDDDLDQFKFLEIRQFFELLIKYNSDLILSVNDDIDQITIHENILYLLSRFIGSNIDYGLRFWKIEYLYNFIGNSISVFINGDKSVYVNFLAALATGKSCAQIAYDHLILNDFIPLNLDNNENTFSSRPNHIKFNWDIIFMSLNEFILKAQNYTSNTIVNFDLNLLKAILRLIRQVAHYSIQARTTLYENPKYQAVNHLFNLLSCRLESLGDYIKISLHASIFRTISAFCLPINGKHIDITRQIWLMLEQSQFLKSNIKMNNVQQSNYYLIKRKSIYQNYLQSYNNQSLIKWKSFADQELNSKSNLTISTINGSQSSPQLPNNMLYELEEVESSIGIYSETIAFMNLISILSQNLQNYSFYDKRLNNLSSVDYVNYVMNDIFMKAFERDYKYPYQKWEIIESALRIFNQWFNSFNIEGSFLNKEMIQNMKNYTKSTKSNDRSEDQNPENDEKEVDVLNTKEEEDEASPSNSNLALSEKSISETSINEDAEALSRISLLNLALHPGCQMMCKILEGSEFLTSVLQILYCQDFKEDSDNVNDRLISHLKSQSIEHILQLLLTVLNTQDAFLGRLIPQISSFNLPYTIPEAMTHLDEFFAFCPEIIVNLSTLINNPINENISIYVSKILLNLSLSPYFQETNTLQIEDHGTLVQQKCNSLAHILASSDQSEDILNGFTKVIKQYEIENPIQLPYYYSGLDIFGRFLTENVYDSKTIEDIMNLLEIHELNELPIVANTLQTAVLNLLLNNQLSDDTQPKLAPLANYILGIGLKKKKKNNKKNKNKTIMNTGTMNSIHGLDSDHRFEADEDDLYAEEDEEDDYDEEFSSEDEFLEEESSNHRNVNSEDYIKNGCFKELLEILKNEINMPAHKNPYLSEKACEVLYRLCASKNTEKIIFHYLRFDENLNAIQLKGLPLKHQFNGIIVDTVLHAEDPEHRQYPRQFDFTNKVIKTYLSKASVVISQLIRQKWIMKITALDLHTIKNQDSCKHYIQQLMKLLLQPVVNQDNNVSNRLLSILSSIDDIPKKPLSLEFKEETKLFYLRKIDYNQFIQKNSQGVPVYDITRIYRIMVIYRMYLEKHNIITTQSQKDMYYLEMRQVLEHIFAVNHSREMISAQYNYVKAWIEIVETIYLKCNKFMTYDQRTIVLYNIIIELLLRGSLEENQDFVLLYVKTAVTLMIQLIQNTTEINSILKETTKEDQKANNPLAYHLVELLLKLFLKVRRGKVVNEEQGPVYESIRGYLYTLIIKCIDYSMASDIQYTGHLEDLEVTPSAKELEQWIARQEKQKELVENTPPAEFINTVLKMFYKYFRVLMESASYDLFKGQMIWRITAYTFISKLCKFTRTVFHMDYVLKFIKENKIMYLILKDFNEKSMIESIHDIIQNDNPISLNALYLYESKMSFLLSLSETMEGIHLILSNGLLETFSKFSFLNLKPEYENVNTDIGTFIPSLRERYHQLLYPILQLLVRISSFYNDQNDMATVDRDFKEQMIQRYYSYMKKVAQFIRIYKDIFMIIMKDRITTLKSMKELELITAVFSYLTDYEQLLTEILPGPGNNSFHSLLINLYQKYSLIQEWLPHLKPINEIEKYLSYQPIQISSNKYVKSVYQWEAYQLRNKICMNTMKYLFLISTNKSIWSLISKDDFVNITPIFVYENIIVSQQNMYGIKKLPTLYDLICCINENLEDVLAMASDVRELSEKYHAYQTHKNVGYNAKLQEIQQGLARLVELKSHEISHYLYIIEHSFTLLWSHLLYYKEMDQTKWTHFMNEVNPMIELPMSKVILNTLNKLKQFVVPIEISDILPKDTTNYQKFAQVMTKAIKDLLI